MSKATLLALVTSESHESKPGTGQFRFPMNPPGTRVRVLASNPKSPNREQLWLVEGKAPLLEQFVGTGAVRGLAYQEAQGLGASWRPGFQLDPFYVNLLGG